MIVDKSTRHLADTLTASGHPVSHMRISDLLHSLGYSLQGNAKAVEGHQHPDRDGQFDHINSAARRYLKTGDPVISVDTKKEEPAPRGALPYPQSSWEEFGGSIPGSNG